MAPPQLEVAGQRVRFDEYLMRCSCGTWKRTHTKWTANGQHDACVPVCAHILAVLRDQSDWLAAVQGKLISVVVFATTHKLSVEVFLEKADEEGLIGCRLSTTRGATFIGFLPLTASRQEIRALALPVMLQHFFSVKCPECGTLPVNVTRAELIDPDNIATAVFHSGYLMRHGTCQRCNVDDLIPNPSPNPPGTTRPVPRRTKR